VMCQRIFISVFRAVFFTQLNCTFYLRVYRALNPYFQVDPTEGAQCLGLRNLNVFTFLNFIKTKDYNFCRLRFDTLLFGTQVTIFRREVEKGTKHETRSDKPEMFHGRCSSMSLTCEEIQ
jgi:hypothetical protein